jgi:streptogramin lyase
VPSGTSTLVDDQINGGLSAKFWLPAGVALDPRGTGVLYVADYNNNAIRKLTPTSNGYSVITIAGSQPSNSSNCTANMVSNISYNTCQGYQNGSGINALFAAPFGIAADLNGNIYVSDGHNNAIRKLAPVNSAGGIIYDVTTLAGPQPSSGTPVYSYNGNQLVGSAGYVDGAGANARFKLPAGIAVDSSGYIFVADYGNNVVRMITPSGVVSTIAGSGNPITIDGTGTSASFSSPSGIAIDAYDNIYILESGGIRVIK